MASCGIGLAGCLLTPSNQLYFADANAERQPDDHLLTRAEIQCDGDCGADARHCIKVTWEGASTNKVVTTGEACSDRALATHERETLEVVTQVAVATGASIVGTIELVDHAGRRIPTGESSLGAVEDTEETLANP